MSEPVQRFLGSGETLARLHAWCEEAEQSGIKALQQFSARLKGYTLVQAAH